MLNQTDKKLSLKIFYWESSKKGKETAIFITKLHGRYSLSRL